MGINGLLPKVLPSAGRENYDLCSLKDGLLCPISDTSRKRKRSEAEAHEQSQKRRWVRRKVRIAVDLNGWISRACHGHGAYLMDERHLSYHGRANLKKERAEHNGDKNNNSPTAPNENEGDQPLAVVQQQQQQLKYVTKCIQFILQRITYLTTECNVQVLLVLDGSTPPIKQTVVNQRKEIRRKAAEERDLNQSPQKQQPDEVDEAIATENEVLSRISASKRAGSGIDPALRKLLYSHLLDELKSRSLPFLIAPYEADGQLAYLSANGQVDAVITEDSDLIAVGIDRLIYKLGESNGENDANRSTGGLMGTLLCRSDLGAARGINLLDFSDAMLVVMFVAAGCDYCNSLRGIGIVTATKIVAEVFFSAKGDEPVLKRVLDKLCGSCHNEEKERMKRGDAREAYEKAFLGAVAMFRHPLVYDPVLGHIIANDVSSGNNDNSARVSVCPSFLREEEGLMQYEQYRLLVTDTEALYEVVGRPSAPGKAHKMARGLIQTRTSSDPREEAKETRDGAMNMQEEEVDFNQPTQGTASGMSSNSSGLHPSTQEFSIDATGTQPSSQEFSVVGRGTQQSKSSSDKTLSSLSPDLLASPSPARCHNN